MLRLLFSLLCILACFQTCNQAAPVQVVGPQHYDLGKPAVYPMPASLDEISGIAFNKGNPDTIYAEQDEDGRLFYFTPANSNAGNQKFGKKGDYEDIAICNGKVHLLRSDGTLFSFPL